MGLVISSQDVRTMSAPFSCMVLVHGILIPTHSRPVASFAHFTRVPRVTWYFGSNLFALGTRNSPPLKICQYLISKLVESHTCTPPSTGWSYKPRLQHQTSSRGRVPLI